MLVNRINSKLEEIKNLIFNDIKNKDIDSIQDSGLFSGTFGVILFLAYFVYYNKSLENIKIFSQYLQRCVNRLKHENITFSYCNGISGIINCISLLNRKNMLNIDVSELRKSIDVNMQSILKFSLRNYCYDFLHGGIGIAVANIDNPEFVNITVQELANNCVKMDDQIKWKSVLDSSGKIGYNISLSHGMSSIIVYLSEVIKRSIISPELPRELLKGSVKYILSQEMDFSKYGSHYPSLSLEQARKEKSKLAWCYGDLGIASALLQAGEALNNNELIDKSIRVFYDNTNRIDIFEENISDTSICHGTAGLSAIYKYVYNKTNDPIFYDTSKHWIIKTLNYDMNFEKVELYKSNEDLLHNKYEFLEGLSGVGLSLFSFLNEDDDWFKLILLY